MEIWGSGRTPTNLNNKTMETELISHELGMSFLRPKNTNKLAWVGVAVLGIGLAWAIIYLFIG